MRLFGILAASALLLADLASTANADVAERSLSVRGAPIKYHKLTVTKIVEMLKCHQGQKFCSTYLRWTKSPTVTRTKTKTRWRKATTTRTTTVTETACVSTDPYTYDTTTLFIGPATTITELEVTSTPVFLIFGGPIGDAEEKKIKMKERDVDATLEKRRLRYPDPRLEHQPCASLSRACSKVIRRPGTRTRTRTSWTTRTAPPSTRTVTVSSCTDTTVDFILATTIAPSETIEGPGFHTVTVEGATETIEYFCYPYGLGCADVPTPCCPGHCTNIDDEVKTLFGATLSPGGSWGNRCAPEDPEEFSSFFGLTAAATTTTTTTVG
ncbi:hypothetical protein Dda_0185 [Drechslerella dactyloides]|uniref:Uncharacterized protein n=1 Tax=Drechslerella dactyloides TaxID=74499 RepID=A0AAD6J666_DREDA|nr:hypothetical protein Dda_0185 [Drechslerella dactyloides]